MSKETTNSADSAKNPELNLAQRLDLIMRKKQLGKELDETDIAAIEEALSRSIKKTDKKELPKDMGLALEVLRIFERAKNLFWEIDALDLDVHNANEAVKRSDPKITDILTMGIQGESDELDLKKSELEILRDQIRQKFIDLSDSTRSFVSSMLKEDEVVIVLGEEYGDSVASEFAG